MSTIASQIFNRASSDGNEQEQLLKLFWNRAELKKEFDKLRAEAHGLNDQIARQEALTLRVQQRMEQLEAHLANPQTADRAIVYYQLRGIWSGCHQRIASLAKDFERACRDREYREHVAAFRSSLNSSLESVHRQISRVGKQGDELAADIKLLREQRSRKFGVWNFLSRRQLTADINGKRLERKLIGLRLRELNDELQSRSAEEPPEFVGLSIEARRLINIRIIAFAQELCLHFATDDLANLAREASARPLTDVRYGSRRDCRALSRAAEDVQQALEADSACLKRVQLRARHLLRCCEYRNDTDTVPTAESLGGITRLDSEGRKAGQASSVNVLVDEYWEIFSVLFD
jgi:hypothetical protein